MLCCMAKVPTFLYLGGPTINGAGSTGAVPAPEPGLAVVGGFYLSSYSREDLTRDIGSNSTHQPFWDGTAGVPNVNGATANGQFVVDASPAPTTTVFKLTGATFTPNEHNGKTLYVDAALGLAPEDQSGVIESHTADTFTLTAASALTVPPAASTVVHIGEGAWKTYHAIATRNELPGSPDRTGGAGDNWYFPGGFGPSLTMMNRFASLYPTAPNFRVYKRASSGGLAAFNGGAIWAAFEADVDNAFSAEKFGGDTPAYLGIVLDFAIDDIAAKSTTYIADIAGVVALLQAKFGTTVPIWFVNPPEGMWSESKFQADGITPYSRAIRYQTMLATSFSSTVNVIDASTCELNAIADADGTTEPKGYSVGGVMAMGRLVATAIESYHLAPPTVQPGTGLATYFLIGDSQCVGQVPFEYILHGGQPSLLGETPGSSIRSGQWVINENTGQFELYDVSSNDNANGSNGSQYGGPSASFLRRLGEVHTDGVLLIKVAKGGTTLTSEGDDVLGLGTFDPTVSDGMWDKLTAVLSMAIERVYGQLARVLDVRGFGMILTDNDARAGSAAVAALQEKLPQFIKEVRANFTTRTDWTLPVVSHLIADHVDNGGTSDHGTASDRAAVRAAWQSLAASDQHLKLASDTGLELQYDKTHYGGEANIELGTRLANLLLSMQSASTGATGSGSGTNKSLVDGSDVAQKAGQKSGAGAISTAASGDIVKAIDDAIAGRGDVSSYTINGRTVTLTSLPDLIKARQYFLALNSRARGLRSTRVRFSR